jgi:hypothetical protein
MRAIIARPLEGFGGLFLSQPGRCAQGGESSADVPAQQRGADGVCHTAPFLCVDVANKLNIAQRRRTTPTPHVRHSFRDAIQVSRHLSH